MRTEKDCIGEKSIPDDAYYGINALRSAENFSISGRRLDGAFIKSLILVKKAAAVTNLAAGLLPNDKADAILTACDEALSGRFDGSFIVDPLEGGAGTSINMNANEIIANRAIELLGGARGDYSLVHPNDHVNLSQSTNDVIPTAIRLTVISLCGLLTEELTGLSRSFLEKAEEFSDVLKPGRTHLQDAVPISLGQELAAYGHAVARCTERLTGVMHELSVVNLGGTAIGTGINASRFYRENIVPTLSRLCGIPLSPAEDPIDATQSADGYVSVSGALKSCAVTLSKIAGDLRLLSSGPCAGLHELVLPEVQSGSSIMPGKLNPVIPEVVSQVTFRVIGNDLCITMAAEAGQLELNPFVPVIADSLFESLHILTAAVSSFRKNCVSGIRADRERCLRELCDSNATVTALCPHIGYDKAVSVAQRALHEKRSVRDIVAEEGLIPPDELARILDPQKLI